MDRDYESSQLEEFRPPPPRGNGGGKPSGSMLSIFLAGGVGLLCIAVLLFLAAPLGGVVLSMVALAALLAAFCAFHYVIWGWWMGGVIRSEVAAEELAEEQRAAAWRSAKANGELKVVELPLGLIIVAVLFILTGILSILDFGFQLAHGSLRINPSVWNLFIGWGLFYRSEAARAWAIVFTTVSLIGCIVAGAVLGFAQHDLSLVALCAGIFLFEGWQMWVLTRPEVREAFYRPPMPEHNW